MKPGEGWIEHCTGQRDSQNEEQGIERFVDRSKEGYDEEYEDGPGSGRTYGAMPVLVAEANK